MPALRRAELMDEDPTQPALVDDLGRRPCRRVDPVEDG